MKREDLRTKLIAAGINEENLASVVDYIMAANGADVEGFKKKASSMFKDLGLESQYNTIQEIINN